MCDNLTCSICTEDLTIKNIINTECNHPTCKSCFWRWAKDKNTCPFCREHLLKNDEEAKRTLLASLGTDQLIAYIPDVENPFVLVLKFDNLSL